ncbi:unnamed protein product [Peronospora farinosa]|uniref:TPX2 central domain-containing protein n=1 Tax=Peronospora farinosa TaxID=134698 RepID=A0AAV0UJG8_9STRA|nr:unnamed protein product [Peronospora farinosa]
MAETLEDDEVFNWSSNRNPFDALTSDRDHFPSFEAALAHEESIEKEEKKEIEEQDDGLALNWSIDALAELKPMTFSPLSQQEKANNSFETSRGTNSFFEDEKQYDVLRTPLPVIRSSKDKAAVATSRSRKTRTTSPSIPMDLHRRQRATTTHCAAGMQETQHKMEKLLPPLTPKRSPRQRTTSSSRSTSPRPTKRNSHRTAMTTNNEWESPPVGRPKWSASPIATLCTTPTALPFDAITPSPLVNTSSNKTPKQRSKLRLSFGLSPITLPSPE